MGGTECEFYFFTCCISVSPLKCYKCPRQDSTDQHCLAEGLLLGEVTICSNAENSCESQVIGKNIISALVQTSNGWKNS